MKFHTLPQPNYFDLPYLAIRYDLPTSLRFQQAPLQGAVSASGDAGTALAGDVGTAVGSAVAAPLVAIGQIARAFTPGTPVGGSSSDGAVAPIQTPGGLFGIGAKTIPGLVGPAPEAVYAPQQQPQALATAPNSPPPLSLMTPTYDNTPVAPRAFQLRTEQNTQVPQGQPQQPLSTQPLTAPSAPQQPIIPYLSNAQGNPVLNPQLAAMSNPAPDENAPIGPPPEAQMLQGAISEDSAGGVAPEQEQPDWMEQFQQFVQPMVNKFGGWINSLDPLAAIEQATQPQAAEAATKPIWQQLAEASSNSAKPPAAPTPASGRVPPPPNTPALPSAAPNSAGQIPPNAKPPSTSMVSPPTAVAPNANQLNALTAAQDSRSAADEGIKEAMQAKDNSTLAQALSQVAKAPVDNHTLNKIIATANALSETSFRSLNDFDRAVDTAIDAMNRAEDPSHPEQSGLIAKMNKAEAAIFTQPIPYLYDIDATRNISREERMAAIAGKIASFHNQNERYLTSAPSQREREQVTNRAVTKDVNGRDVYGAYQPPLEMKGPLNKLRWALGHAEPSQRALTKQEDADIQTNRAAKIAANNTQVEKLMKEADGLVALRTQISQTAQAKTAQMYNALMQQLQLKRDILTSKNQALAIPLANYIAAQGIQSQRLMQDLRAQADATSALVAGTAAANTLLSNERANNAADASAVAARQKVKEERGKTIAELMKIYSKGGARVPPKLEKTFQEYLDELSNESPGVSK